LHNQICKILRGSDLFHYPIYLIMETSIPISYLNDFIFCPRSIYFHQLYGKPKRIAYQKTPQIKGLQAHKSIDQQTYSTSSHILQGIEVYTDKYKIHGKIDQFNTKTSELTEKKKRIKVIYDGYIFQIYAQYFGLKEAGYTVNTLKLYSIDDNKSHLVKLPEQDTEMLQKFETTIQALHNYDLKAPFIPNINKCRNCIYNNLCDQSLC